MKKLLILLTILICVGCSPKVVDTQMGDQLNPDFSKMKWSGWCKDSDSLNHNVLYAPTQDSVNVMIVDITY